ncbi:MAG: Sapep family Mn(2+)-dependent dipeptidase [Atopobiaceae bacterium]|jgi:succinyl-diaminopimelate desuccinylase|nr:Sapep family Mn(2+)-dependent dipeptidase [Atopobiaceae bacterium]MCI2172764.1 Sapep family Mn(2+)-dependent dipeptidase [Atopobiaceae bacterium]MCI2207071.1 Sapep family Mn(2+)-dependent dipeptidase [Atopobiaceae bacterium]
MAADDALKREIDDYVDRAWDDLVDDMDSLVSIESVENLDEAKPGEPWGHESRRALDCAVGIADKLGLDAHNMDGYIGYADLAGASDKQIAMIAHTDIVPLGTGWTFDPLSVTRKDGYLIGRGCLDDKGPCVVSLYTAAFFKGRDLPYTIRCILGNNEETGMGDVDYYLKHEPEPAWLFSPDADFPVICGEKGGFSATYDSGAIVGDVIVDFDGGTVGNAIPGLASVTVRADASKLPAATDIDIEDAGDGLAKLTAHGKGGHASLPAGTVNAIGMLVDYLLDNSLYGQKEHPFLLLQKAIFSSTDGSTLGIAATDDIFDPLTCIGGTIRTKDGHLYQTIDSRYPKSTTGEYLRKTLTALGEKYGATLTVDMDMVPFYVEPDSAPIQTMVATYNEYTGRDAKPFTIGGGTYSRDFKHAASFGPNDPSIPTPSWVGPEHGPDEGISEDALKRAMKIYIMTITRLMELDL